MTCRHFQPADGLPPGFGSCGLKAFGESPITQAVCLTCSLRTEVPGTPPTVDPHAAASLPAHGGGASPGCTTCSSVAVPVVRWLGIEWYGMPRPIRWLLPRFFATHPGCGCIRRLRDWVDELTLHPSPLPFIPTAEQLALP